MWSVPTSVFCLAQVTVVELGGLRPGPALSGCHLQQRCQASTTISPAPGLKDSLQVQIQGNQIHHLGRLLLGEHPPEETETLVLLGKDLPTN